MQMPKTFAQMMMAAVAIAGMIALVYVGLHVMGIAIPAWVVQVFWILVVCFVIIGAIKAVAGMWGQEGP